jgi:hypothetical protein
MRKTAGGNSLLMDASEGGPNVPVGDEGVELAFCGK